MIEIYKPSMHQVDVAYNSIRKRNWKKREKRQNSCYSWSM